jgi:hypothetical protein
MNSRNKGKVGEREWAKWLRTHCGVDARRGVQYSGGADSPDVTGFPGLHFEVKRVEALNLGKAVKQAVRDSDSKIPVVAHRKNREDWLITFRASDLERFVKTVIREATWPEMKEQ